MSTVTKYQEEMSRHYYSAQMLPVNFKTSVFYTPIDLDSLRELDTNLKDTVFIKGII